MKKILATAAVLAFAGSAFAGSFAVNGAVDFAGGTVAGGLGSALTYDGTPNLVPGGFGTPAGIWNGNDTQTGVSIASPDFSSVAVTAFAPGSAGWGGGQYAGAYFNSAGAAIPSGPVSLAEGDFQAVLLGNFDSGVSNINFETAFIQIDGTNRQFNGFDALSPDGNYSLTLTTDSAGATKMWVINGVIPTPGAAGLLGLAGLAAVRRRR
jgi:hypothetical protein